MAAPKPLSRQTLPEEVVKADRKKCKKYDQCGLGQKAIYMGSSLSPRKYYIPYEAVTHVFKRVAVSNGTGKGFLTPILYIVVRYDDGKEQQCSFRYLKDADQMMDAIEAAHPQIQTMSPEGVRKTEEKKAREEKIANAELSEAAEHEVRLLNNARIDLEKRPSLYEKLAVTARRKRTADLINPVYPKIAIAVFLAGAVLIVVGALLARRGGMGSMPILIMLIGAAAMFLMFNSKAMPTPSRNRRRLTWDYEEALTAMKHGLKGSDYPFDPAYAHPIVIDRCIRIIREGRADTAQTALTVLKADLKAADSSVALSGKDYEDVVTIKPLFTVNNYR